MQPLGLSDDAADEVETKVVGTFDVEPRGGLFNWSSGSSWTGYSYGSYALRGMSIMPRTGDAAWAAIAALAALAALAAMVLAAAAMARRKHKVK